MAWDWAGFHGSLWGDRPDSRHRELRRGLARRGKRAVLGALSRPDRQMLAIAAEGFSAPAAKQTVVVPANVYLSPDGSPAVIDLDGPPLASDGTLLYNPALALTPGADVNVFHLVRSDTTRPMTVVVTTTDPVVKNIQPTSPCLEISPRILWITSAGESEPLNSCASVSSSRRRRISTSAANPPPSFDRCSIRSVEASTSASRRVAGSVLAEDCGRVPRGRPAHRPDRFEENDFCDGADVNFADPQTQISVAPPASEVLTIDQPYDVDWYRFTVPIRRRTGSSSPCASPRCRSVQPIPATSEWRCLAWTAWISPSRVGPQNPTRPGRTKGCRWSCRRGLLSAGGG